MNIAYSGGERKKLTWQAELQLRLLASFEAEFEAIKADGIPDLKSVGAELQAESWGGGAKC